MTSKSSPVDSPEFQRVQSNYLRAPGNYGTSPEVSAIVSPNFSLPDDRLHSKRAQAPRKHQPILSGLPNEVYDLSSVILTPTTAGGRSETGTEPEPEPEPLSASSSASLTTNSKPSNLSKLLSLLPRKKRRHRQTTPGPAGEANEEGSEDDDDGSSEVESRAARRRKPTLKRGDEASHLRRDEREEYQKKRDARLAHYKLVDSFQLHTEQVLWI